MRDMPDNPFERQVADVARRAVGPVRDVDALEIAHQAAVASRHRSWRWANGLVQFVAGGLVVAVFVVFLLLGGAFPGEQDPDAAIVGSSPSAAPSGSIAPDEAAPTLPPEELSYATGRFDAVFDGALFQDVPGYAAELAGPRWFDVTSSDPRLEGEATYLEHTADWGAQPWLFVAQGRLQIENDGGSWIGMTGPFLNMGAAPPGQAPAAGSAGPTSPLASAGPAILEGSGAYEGYTALIRRTADEDSEEARYGTAGFGDGPFEALIINRTWPGAPSEDVWLRELRRTGQGG